MNYYDYDDFQGGFFYCFINILQADSFSLNYSRCKINFLIGNSLQEREFISPNRGAIHHLQIISLAPIRTSRTKSSKGFA